MRHRPPTTERADHPAVSAWTRLSGRTAPALTRVETLQKKRKGVVYRLTGVGPGGSDVVAKRSSPERIRREALAYEQVLPTLAVPGVRYYGMLADADSEDAWLLLAHAGDERYAPLDEEHRVLAARWLGLLHTAAARPADAGRPPDRGPAHYLGELRSARDEIVRHLDNPALGPGDVTVLDALVRQCDAVASRWQEVEAVCDLTPPTFVHGDFAPKNLRVERNGSAAVLRPFDWASAGWGTPAPDLAQLGATASTYWANPRLDVYRAAVAGSWPDLGSRDLAGLAAVGKLFRSLVCIRLEATGLASDWPESAMGNMRFYRADMEDALAATGWDPMSG